MIFALEALPPEVIDHVVTLLNLRDIASLRLTGRNVKSKISLSQPHVAKFFARKDVELAAEPLENMALMTSQGHLGRLLQHCTITGVVENDTSSAPSIDEHVRLLTKAFTNLKRHSSNGMLASLFLRVTARSNDSNDGTPAPDTPPPHREIWATALRTFRVTVAALHASQLPIDEHLDIFGGVLGCSLAYDAILPLTRLFITTPVLSWLKKLSMSLSSPYIDSQEGTPDVAIDVPHRSSQRLDVVLALQDILELSSIMPNLESLDVHWYKVRNYRFTELVNAGTHLRSNGHANFAHLKACTLRGAYISESDLLDFVKIIHPAALTMTDIHLASGTYASMFEYLTSSDTSVRSYHLDDLHEGGRLVHFEVPGQSKFRYRGDTMGPSTLTRQAEEAKEMIRYRFALGRVLGSVERTRWLRRKALEFGPPRPGQGRSMLS
ncbi:hypothetical protein GGR54DRAFT_138410 [Hypoxylon sp. NC1633]|nr:hypothetical protein GGR54DRAFT_138410 [Hypoxylon sp. NC1633]